MLIKIDNRESELIRCCKYILDISPSYKDIKLVVENLPLGDIILSSTFEKVCNGVSGKSLSENVDNQEKPISLVETKMFGSTYEKVEDRVIIERKSLNDLSASIKDGRYEEQSYRLNGSDFHNHNVIYLIEGDLNRPNLFKDRIDKTMLYSAMVSLQQFKGFSVMRSMNIEETAVIICNMAYKIAKSEKEGKHAYYSNSSLGSKEEKDKMKEENENEKGEPQEAPDNYCSVVKKVKKENITPENIGEIMLSQIPGISSVTAIEIMSQFKSLPNLVMKIKENEKCLENLSYTNSKGQVRKINKSALSNIIAFLKV